MTLRRLCLLAGVLLSLSVVGQAHVAQAQHRDAQQDTAQLIETVQSRLILDEVVEGAFQQDKYISVLPQPLRSEGRFSFDPEQGLVWETLRPIANRLTVSEQGIRQTVDGQVVWQVDADQPAAVTISQVMSSVLALNWEALQDYFMLEGKVDDEGWQLYLEPRDATLKQVVETITIAGDSSLESMMLMEANSDRTEIRFMPLSALEP